MQASARSTIPIQGSEVNEVSLPDSVILKSFDWRTFSTRGAIIRFAHDTIRIVIQIPRYDTYIDTFEMLWTIIKINNPIDLGII